MPTATGSTYRLAMSSTGAGDTKNKVNIAFTDEFSQYVYATLYKKLRHLEAPTRILASR